MNRQAKMKPTRFYRDISGALILAITSTKARIVSTGYMLTGMRDWNLAGGPYTAEEAAEHWVQYDLADLAAWRDEALGLGGKPWQPLGPCEAKEIEQDDEE